jgi:hypothetical protein
MDRVAAMPDDQRATGDGRSLDVVGSGLTKQDALSTREAASGSMQIRSRSTCAHPLTHCGGILRQGW